MDPSGEIDESQTFAVDENATQVNWIAYLLVMLGVLCALLYYVINSMFHCATPEDAIKEKFRNKAKAK